jgi:hypothetical protein
VQPIVLQVSRSAEETFDHLRFSIGMAQNNSTGWPSEAAMAVGKAVIFSFKHNKGSAAARLS